MAASSRLALLEEIARHLPEGRDPASLFEVISPPILEAISLRGATLILREKGLGELRCPREGAVPAGPVLSKASTALPQTMCQAVNVSDNVSLPTDMCQATDNVLSPAHYLPRGQTRARLHTTVGGRAAPTEQLPRRRARL